jgi:hypothetical protein
MPSFRHCRPRTYSPWWLAVIAALAALGWLIQQFQH